MKNGQIFNLEDNVKFRGIKGKIRSGVVIDYDKQTKKYKIEECRKKVIYKFTVDKLTKVKSIQFCFFF